jgi:hypothetical protein
MVHQLHGNEGPPAAVEPKKTPEEIERERRKRSNAQRATGVRPALSDHARLPVRPPRPQM